MDDDLLFGGPHHRFSPDRQWAGSPPSCSQQDDGYRITWAPAVNAVLAKCKTNSSTTNKSTSLLASVKRSSANAGFPSPTRPQASTSSSGNMGNTSHTSASDTSLDTSTSSSSSSSSSSRLSKRRRRFVASSSTPALDLGISAANNTSHGGNRSLSADDSGSDVTELLGELARRLEANRNKALEKENRPRPPLANKKNLIPTRPASDTSNAKGKQREKVAISPAVSTVLEESMSQGMAGMLLNSGESYLRQPSGRDVLVPNDTNTAASGATTIRLAQPAFDLPKSSDLEDSGYTSRGNATTAAAGIACRPLDPLTPSKAGSSQRSSLQKAASSNAVLGRPTFNGQTKVAKPDSVPKQAGPTATLQVNSTMEDEFWDENDKSLEIAMSQMDIPDPPSSQQGGRSQSTSALNLPVPPERLRQASNDGTGVWAPFKSRDKREREKSSDASSGSVGKLSSKPLAAIQPSIVQVSTSTTNARTTSTASTLSTTAKKPARTLVKSTSTSSDKSATAINVVARPAMGPTRSLSSNLMPSAGLTKAFKCPTVTNATAAKAEQDKKAATAAKLKLAGQPLPADEAWMEDMDWDGDADDSL